MKTYTENHYGDYRETEQSNSLRASGATLGGGSEVLVMSYQTVTGTLSCGGHPGGFNGQDAYNDMLVVENGETDFVHRGG